LADATASRAFSVKRFRSIDAPSGVSAVFAKRV
jgi:hypothetical protein